jgi:hypothetical protein
MIATKMMKKSSYHPQNKLYKPLSHRIEGFLLCDFSVEAAENPNRTGKAATISRKSKPGGERL